MNRVYKFKMLLWTITGLAAAVGITRFIFGLGAATNLTDSTPWGFWIGFDVMGGVALAAGGFVLTAFYYIMKREEFHPLVKPAVLTAFLGYVAVVGGLLFDLGLPWNIWHMIVFWNPHSPLFEVGWCVMLYTSVLLLEFSPVPLEEFSRYAKIRNFLMKFRFPLVLLGIMLSTLHQSSLGSLFLIMPFKLYPLWYSNIMPIQFFISAVALGLMMVSFESKFTHWLYKRPAETPLVAKLGKAVVWVLATYLIVKFTDLAVTGKIGMIFNGNWESNLFITEIMISSVIPLIIFAIPKLRNNSRWQWVGSIMVVGGMVFNRIDVGGLTMVGTTGDFYIPSWTELTISFGVVSAAALVFLFAVEHFHVWETRPKDPESEPYTAPRFAGIAHTWLGNPNVTARIKYSLAFILAFAIGFALMPERKIYSEGIEQVKAVPARGGDTLFIDGNQNFYGVSFDHKMHVEKNGLNEACAKCHHMNLPMDKNSQCASCHSYMYTATDAFHHDWHASPTGGNIPCNDCHKPGVTKNAESAKKCSDCHADLVVPGATIKVEQYMAPAYADAMHGLCISCHEQKVETHQTDKAELARCNTCHKEDMSTIAGKAFKYEHLDKQVNRVLLPGTSLK